MRCLCCSSTPMPARPRSFAATSMPGPALDPMMAQAEIEDGARLFYRDKNANTWGILNVREEFLKDHPDLGESGVLAVYEQARKYSLANHGEDEQRLHRRRPSCRVRWSTSSLKASAPISPTARSARSKRESILGFAGLALQQAGVIKADVDVKATVDVR